jgi:hypothetical protein
MHSLRLNYSVFSLLAFLAFAALACAATLNANSLWAGITFNVAVGAMFWAAAGAICRRGEARGYWLCFLVFGGGYLMLAFGPWFYANVRPELVTAKLVTKLYDSVRRIEPDNPAGASVYLSSTGRVFVNNEEVEPEEIPQKLGRTSKKNVYVYEDDPAGITDPDYLLVRNQFWGALSGGYVSVNTANAASVSVPRRNHFDRVCHSLWAILFALVGGLLAGWFRRRETTAENRVI